MYLLSRYFFGTMTMVIKQLPIIVVYLQLLRGLTDLGVMIELLPPSPLFRFYFIYNDIWGLLEVAQSAKDKVRIFLLVKLFAKLFVGDRDCIVGLVIHRCALGDRYFCLLYLCNNQRRSIWYFLVPLIFVDEKLMIVIGGYSVGIE